MELASCGSPSSLATTSRWKIAATFDTTPDYLSCPTSKVCFAGGLQTNYLLKTTDGGSKWTAIPIPQNVPKQLYQSLSCATARICVLAGQLLVPNSPALIWATKNGGTSWERQSLPGSSGNSVGGNGFNASCAPDGTCMISSGNTIWSEPYGTFVWGIVATLSGQNGTVDYVNCDSPRLCFSMSNFNSGKEYIATTHDGGSNWTVSRRVISGILTTPPVCDNSGMCTMTSAAGTKVSGTYIYMPRTKNLLTFWVSSDYGSTWRNMRIPLGGNSRGLGSCSSALVCQYQGSRSRDDAAATYPSFYSTKNGGKSWSAEKAPKTNGLVTLACFRDRSCIGIGDGAGTSNVGRGVVLVKSSR